MWLSQVRRVFGDDKVCGATQSMHKAQCWNPQQQLHTSSFYFRSRLAYLPHSCRIQSRALFPVLISVDNERMGSSGASTNTFERRANPNDKLPPT